MDRQKCAMLWNIAKLAWCILAICLLPLVVMLTSGSPAPLLPLVSFSAGAILSLSVAVFATQRARRCGTTFFDPYGTGVDSQKYSFSLGKGKKTLNFVPLRLLVVAIVFVIFFALGASVGAWMRSTPFATFPGLIHWLIALSVGGFLGSVETIVIWEKFIDFGTDRGTPGPVSIGLASGYLIATTSEFLA